LLSFLQERQSDSCESMSEATSQSSSSCDRLATLQAMGTDSSPPSSPDSHLHRCQQHYNSAAAEMSPMRDCCEETASMSDAASSSTIAPMSGIAASRAIVSDSQVCASDACFVHASLVLRLESCACIMYLAWTRCYSCMHCLHASDVNNPVLLDNNYLTCWSHVDVCVLLLPGLQSAKADLPCHMILLFE